MDINVGGLVKECRKKAKMSQEVFADLMHTTQSTISRIEKNLIACEVNFLVKTAKLTGSEDAVIATLFGVDVLAKMVHMVPAFIGGSIWIL